LQGLKVSTSITNGHYPKEKKRKQRKKKQLIKVTEKKARGGKVRHVGKKHVGQSTLGSLWRVITWWHNDKSDGSIPPAQKLKKRVNQLNID